nr:hypothetical protein [Pandoravirus massiliensis]
MSQARRFGSDEAAGAARALEVAWATLRHDAVLYHAGAISDPVHLCQTTCGHLGCALPQCTMLSTGDQVANAIAHIDALADGAWLVYDLARARADAISAATQLVAVATAERPAATHCDRGHADNVRSGVYRAWRPYVDMIHHLHGRLWGVYAPFWALVSRTDAVPSSQVTRWSASLLLSDRPPTPRDLEAVFAPSERSCPATVGAAAQPNTYGPSEAAVCEHQWMEVDQGACMATVARLRAVALARRIARQVDYPPPGDTPWAAGRRTLAGALGASPDTRALLVVKDSRHVLPDGSRAESRKVSLRIDLDVCPFTTEQEQGARVPGPPRGHVGSNRYLIVRTHSSRRIAPRDTRDQTETADEQHATDDDNDDEDNGSIAQRTCDQVSPTIACMQRLCVGKYMLGAWLARIARGSRDALHTLALLDRSSSATHTRPARPGDLGFCPASPYAINGVTVVRRQVALDGCLVAILVRDTYIVQPTVRAAVPALFVAMPCRPSMPRPGRALDRRAAADAMRMLDGNPRPRMSARRALAALRYATWYACGAGLPDGYDAGFVASLLDRVGFHPTRGLVTRLVLLWSS